MIRPALLACSFATILASVVVSRSGANPATEPPAATKLGIFTQSSDIGPVKHAGASAWNGDLDQYEVSGAGTNMWKEKDEFHVVWKKVKGDVILDAQVKFLGNGVDPHRKLGWIVRTSLDADSAYADVAVHGDGLTSLQFRRKAGALTEQVASTVKAPDVIRLSRKGSKLTMAVAKFGDELLASEPVELDLGDEVYVGLFVCSHNPDAVEKGVFSNVRITLPAPADFKPYRDYIGSRLETLDIETGRRKVVHTVADSMQAPNWDADGKSLVYNRNGKLFRFAFATGRAVEIDTAFATRNNNDHVLSPDGKLLGISHHSKDHDGKSMIFTLDAAGGTPKLVTTKGPSYLHGWSPDGQSLLYAGARDGDIDIYRIPVAGGDEVRLTTAKGVDDGPEFTPDGKTIYFNSERSGSMQIWKMHADGTGQTQVTDDGYNNWFPHVSPDGKSVVVISYLKGDVTPADHPFYKRVYLRHLPTAGGPARVIAYVYGGQGTINVSSWSPDGKRIAFVSNTRDP